MILDTVIKIIALHSLLLMGSLNTFKAIRDVATISKLLSNETLAADVYLK